MKKLLIILIALSPLVANAQQLLPISTLGGQQYALTNTKVVANPSDSILYQVFWCLNINCALSNLDSSSVSVLTNTGSVADTVLKNNIIEVQNLSSQPITVYIQRLLINLITTDTLGNIIVPVTIYPNFTSPLVDYISYTPTTDSITLIYSVVPNDTSAQLKIWLRHQSCSIGNAYALPTQTVSGFSIQYLQYKIPVSFGCGYQLGVKLDLANSIGTDTTGFNCANTVACGSPYVTVYDSITTTTVDVNFYGRVATMNQNTTVIDSVWTMADVFVKKTSIVIPAQPLGNSNAFTQVTGLTPNTTYKAKRYALDSLGVLSNSQGPVVFQTQQAPVTLSFVITNTMTTSSLNQRIDVLYTSAVSGVMWPEFSTSSSFSGIIATAPMQTFSGGQATLSYNASSLSSNLYNSNVFLNGNIYWVRFSGNNQNGEIFVSTPISFIFGLTTNVNTDLNNFSQVFVFDSHLIIRDDYVGGIEIYDSGGRIVERLHKSDFEFRQVLSGLKPGIYILRGIGRTGYKFQIR